MYDENGRRYYFNRLSGDVRWGHPNLPPGWTEATNFDESNQPKSYYSHRSGVSQSKFPSGSPASRIQNNMLTNFMEMFSKSVQVVDVCPEGCTRCDPIPMGGHECTYWFENITRSYQE